MQDLTEFLLARIAEDEAAARAASHQKVAGPFHGNWIADSALLMANGALERADRLHIARWDPARVLAECEAKRRMLEMYERAHDPATTDLHLWAAYEPERTAFQRTLEALALPYADHPDYREERRP